MKQGAVSTTWNKVQSFSNIILLKMEILNCVSLLEAKNTTSVTSEYVAVLKMLAPGDM